MTAVAHPVTDVRTPSSTRRLLLAGSIAAPLLFVAGQALFPSLPREIEDAFPLMVEHRDAMLAARLLTAAGAFLFLLIGGPLGFLVPRGVRGSGLLRSGVVITGIGTFSNGSSQLIQGYATEAATDPAVPAEAGAAMVLGVAAGPAGIPFSYWGVPVFALGLLLVAVALLVSRRIGIALPIVLILGLLVAFGSAGLGPVVALTMAPFAIAFVAVVVRASIRGYGAPLPSAHV